MGNLAFNSEERDIEDFFDKDGLRINRIRMMKD